MDDEVMTDDEQDYLADNGTLSIELNDASSSGVSERFSNHSSKTNMLTTTLSESLDQNAPEDGSESLTQFSSLHDDDDDTDDGRDNARDSKMAYQSPTNNIADSGQSVAQNGEDRDNKFCAQENSVPKVGSKRKEQEKGKKEKRRDSREEPEDGEILEDGEIASEEDDLFFGKRPRDDDEYSGMSKSCGNPFPEKSASSQEESEIKSEASDNEVDNVEAEKSESASRRERRKRKRERRDKRRKKNDAKRKRRRLEYVDHDQVNDEYSWNLSSKNRSPSGPYDSPSDKQSSSPYRSPAGPYESPPGLYDSPSDEDDEEGGGPKLVNLIGDNFMDLAVAATEKEDLFKPREKKRGGKKKRSHHHHSSKKRPLLETPRQRTMCKFFKEGKCSKADDCPYSHDFKRTKKTDICKFYLNSICSKGDNCLFMHGEYPCKFYHTGAQCYQGEKCKFSHEPLNDETKALLEKILEHRDEDSSDDDSSREDGSHGNKIPSLFDIKVYPPGQSPKKSVGSSGLQSGRPGFYKDSLSSSPSGNSSCSITPSGSGMGGLGQPRPNIGSPGHPSFLGSRQTPNDCPTQQQSPPQHGCSPPHPQPSGPPGTNYSDNDNASQAQDNLHHPLYHPMHYHHHHGNMPDERYNSEVEERKPVPVEIPSHLPPRQRELFLRIHQQQQLQKTMEAKETKNETKVDDDNWYSSDDDEDKPKLADILKNLNKQPPKPPPSNFPVSRTKNNRQNSSSNSALDIMQMINAIRNPSAAPASGGPTPAASGGPPSVAPGGTTTASSINITPTPTPTTGSTAGPGSSGSSSRRDPRLQAQKGNASTEPKAMPSPAIKSGDPRLLLGKVTTSVPQEIVPPRLPTPPVPVINAIPSVELPYRLFEVSTNKLPLSATVDVFDPRFKNDPRVQKFLSNPPECLKQKAGPLETDQILKSLGVSIPNRIEDISNTIVQPPLPPLPPPPVPAGLPPPPPPPPLLRPHDPRLLRAVPQNSRVLGKKPDDKDSQEPIKPVDPRLMRGGIDPKAFDPRFGGRQQQQSNPIPPGNVRQSHDPRLLRQQDVKVPPPPPPPPSRQSGDPRAARQQSPLRESSLPPLVLPPLPNVNAQPGNPGNQRGPRPPMDQQRFGPRSIPPNRPNNPRLNNPRLNNPRPNNPRPNNPRSMRPENQNRNTDQNESQNTDSTQPKMDHRNDPRFKRKPAADSNNSQLHPPIRKFIGQRKGIMEYSSPLGVEMDKPEQSGGYNSYNRPPNANRQMGNVNKPRTSGADPAPPNFPPSVNPPLPPVSSEPLQQSDPREMGSHSELPGGVPPPGFPPQMPPQSGPNLPYQGMPPDQPKLKDLFKTIDPTASPFC